MYDDSHRSKGGKGSSGREEEMKSRQKSPKAEKYTSSSEKETFLLAKKLARSFKGGEIVFLYGELGAGKTVFAKGIAAGLGLKDVHQVCSPSFTLVNIYQAKFPIFHIDLYRLGHGSDIDELGWEDYLDEGIIVVEWAEKLKVDWKVIKVTIKVEDDDSRKIKVER
jgi:tRNA threonylcarbamoyladenosine biosynthesis protein TsaE